MSPIASTSAVTLDDITVTFTPEASTTTSTLTLTQTTTATTTIEEPTTITLTALPTPTTASFYSSLALNATAFDRATNASSTATLASSAIRTAPYSGALYSIRHSVSGSVLPTSAVNATTVAASSAIRTAVLATVITSEELTKAVPKATASSFRSQIGTTIYSDSSSTHKLAASSSSVVRSSIKESSSAKASPTASSSSQRSSRKSTSSRKAATTHTTHTSASTTAAPVASTSSGSRRVFATSSSSQIKVAISSSSSSSSAAAYVFASAAAVASTSSPAAAEIVYASPTSSSHSSAAASSTAKAKTGSNGTATRSSNVSTFFSSLGNSPGSVAGTVAVAVAIAAVVACLTWLFVRYCRARRARHIQLGSDAGSPDLDGEFGEKTLRAGPAYAHQPEDEEAAIQPEAIWARRLSQLQLSLVGGNAADDEDDSPVVGGAASKEWTPTGNKMTVAQHLRQSRRMSPLGSTPPPPPPTMALPQLPASAHLAVPRPSHPLRESATLTRSPSMYSADEDDRRSVESASKQVLLGGSPVDEESVQVPAQPGSWKQSLDQVMTSTADFLLGRTTPATDLEAQADKYTVFRSQSVAVRRSPLASEFEDGEGQEVTELGYAAAPPGAVHTWAGRGRANTLSGLPSDEQHRRDMAGLAIQGSSAKGTRAARSAAKQLMLPLIVEERAASPSADPFADPAPTSTPLARHSVDGASLASASEEGESDDAASIMTTDSSVEVRNAQRRASVLVVERRRRSEGFALGPRVKAKGRAGSVTSLA